jgi:undecaprenyl-diphosphatase
MSRPADALPIRQAVALGALHGPAELLPVSSSAHMTLVPWLLGWRYAELDGELRKAFEVAVHAGTAAALLIALRHEIPGVSMRRIQLVALSFVPPAVVGKRWERPIEERLGTPGTIAVGLALGSVAMLLADRAPQTRRREDAGALDALLLGLAQASALMPGVSRNGATLAAARARGFTREDANALSRHVALPIILGATALKGSRLVRRGVPHSLAGAFAAGAAAAFASTLGSTWLIRQVERDRSLAPYALYRLGLAGLITARRWRSRR